MTDNTEEYSLVMPFFDQSSSFVHGFEIGKIWTMCENKTWPVRMTVHHANEKQLELLAKHFSCELYVEIIPDCDDWLLITLEHKPKLTIVR